MLLLLLLPPATDNGHFRQLSINNSCARHTHATATPPSLPLRSLPAGIAAQFFICGFIGFLGKLTISEHGGHGGHGTQFGKAFGLHTIDMCAAIKLSFDACRGRGGGREALPVKCKGAISRMPNLTCVCVRLSLSPFVDPHSNRSYQSELAPKVATPAPCPVPPLPTLVPPGKK